MLPRTKGSKNRPKTNNYATQITEKTRTDHNLNYRNRIHPESD